jgi:hypothetical protein
MSFIVPFWPKSAVSGTSRLESGNKVYRFWKVKTIVSKTSKLRHSLLFLETAEPLPDMLARKSYFLEEFHE